MSKPRILFVSSEMLPYTEENSVSSLARILPQKTQENGKEIRNFMPRFGCINERKHQLHEVIRLSGINIIVNEIDHPLIVKVASIQQAKMQVYFIDNEDYFKRKAHLNDPEKNKIFPDTDERMIFFGKGVPETLKKLGWAPHIIHISGWMSALVPLYIKEYFKDEPIFADSQIVVSVFNDGFSGKVDKKLIEKIEKDGINIDNYEELKNPTHENLIKMCCRLADVVVTPEKLSKELNKVVSNTAKEVKSEIDMENAPEMYNQIFDEVLEKIPELA
ncbi:MAG: glycogen synthase [Bacteroidetes bacterium]|nr:MAG: glycogen synthase [Bacteroidota bacterium]